MTRAATLGELGGADRDALRAGCERLAALGDAEFGVRLLADTPTHENRDSALLREWAVVATEFGAGLVPGTEHGPPRVVERTGGIERLLLAKYVSRPVPTVELFTDTLALGEELVELLGWREWYAEGALRCAALAHEDAHRLLHHDPPLRRALREKLGHTVFRLGRFRIAGHVAGAEELAAHGYAAARCGLGRTPLLLTAALALAAESSPAARGN
ncbi:hypothetical protein ABZ639_09590 [Saccharomonospora sp. NPDC006951]